jgi:hypothetical protein
MGAQSKQPSIWSLLAGAGGIYASFILLGLYQVRARVHSMRACRGPPGLPIDWRCVCLRLKLADTHCAI